MNREGSCGGIILGDCPICGDLVWESDWTLNEWDQDIHPRCKGTVAHYTSEIERFKNRVKLLEKEITDLKKYITL